MTRPLVEECERLGHALIEVDRGRHTGPGQPARCSKALADHGLFDRLFSDETVTATDLCSIRQGLARVSTEAETAFAVQGLGAIPIHLSGHAAARGNRAMPGVRSGGSRGRLRPDRAGGGVGCRRAVHQSPRPTGTASGSAERRRTSPTHPTPTSTRCSPGPPRRRLPRDHGVRRRQRNGWCERGDDPDALPTSAGADPP